MFTLTIPERAELFDLRHREQVNYSSQMLRQQLIMNRTIKDHKENF